MLLEPVALPGRADGRGVHFAMISDNRSIRVFVPRVAIHGRGPSLDEGLYMARFIAFREVYEAVAKEKYADAPYRAAVAIDLGDVAGYLARRRQANKVAAANDATSTSDRLAAE